MKTPVTFGHIAWFIQILAWLWLAWLFLSSFFGLFELKDNWYPIHCTKDTRFTRFFLAPDEKGNLITKKIADSVITPDLECHTPTGDENYKKI